MTAKEAGRGECERGGDGLRTERELVNEGRRDKDGGRREHETERDEEKEVVVEAEKREAEGARKREREREAEETEAEAVARTYIGYG